MKPISPIGCAVASLATVLLVGCSSTPVLDASLGRAVTSAVRMETLDLAAAANRAPVNGLEPGASMAVVTRYTRSFAAPPPPSNVFSIGVGTGTGALVSTP